jgi:mannose-6-phosphate isomerase class I
MLTFQEIVLKVFKIELILAMSCSDNVIRAGLTPKFKDKNTLIEVIFLY